MIRKLTRKTFSVVSSFFVILIASTAPASAQLFRSPVHYGVGGIPIAVAVADVNGDGKPDLIVTNSGNRVGVLLGNGDGIFRTVVQYPTGGVGPKSVAVADVNGDGKPDIVVANCSAPGPNACNGGGQNGMIGVLLGNGDGTFRPAITYDSGGQGAASVALADVNRDGKLDLVVSNFFCPSLNAGCVGVLLGNGDGTFQTVLTSTTETNSGVLVVADLNKDGKPDVAVATGSSFGVGILLGNGDGTFQLPIFRGSGGLAGSIAVADVDFDGTPDIVAANLFSTVGVLLGNGKTFEFGSGGNDTQSVAVADLNRDGKPDIVVVNCAPTGVQCTNLSNGVLGVLLGNGDGTFQAAMGFSFSGGALSFSVAASDVNGDGWPDVAVAASNGIDLFLNNSAPDATNTAVTTSRSPSFINQAVTFTATVTSIHGVVSDGRTVTFYDGTTLIGKGTTANGTAEFTTSSLTVGTHTIKAIYPGTLIFKPSSGTVKQVVIKYPTTTGLTSSLNPSQFGQAVTFTAKVTSAGPTPTGKVKFLDGTVGIGSVTLSGGVAKFTTSRLGVGTHPITAEYLGDSVNAKSTSPVLNEVVQ